MKYREVSWTHECDMKDGCKGTIKAYYLEDENGEIVKHVYSECDKCAFNQYG